ncbi:hypothetical protein QTI66_38715 [Variovorax sp. J22R133]|uniref:hypothetical protein n=1 Tax=Variovorax brevis TaxID=3053503 RepID=UPI0025776E54|nr:hypothetical protein [Variovorax sp. J22R133]MDM0118018.1 hypothetical protein [Variovorax sp. J22R133]
MTVLNDIAKAMNSYPLDETTLDIVEVANTSDSKDTHVSSGETWKFKVKLTNNGHVNMTHVSLKVTGMHGTKVSASATAGFSDSIVAADLNPLGGGDSRITNFMFFKPPIVGTTSSTDLLEVQINDWSGDDFNHMFSNHTLSVDKAADEGIVYAKERLTRELNPG